MCFPSLIIMISIYTKRGSTCQETATLHHHTPTAARNVDLLGFVILP